MGVRNMCGIVEKHGHGFREYIHLEKAVIEWKTEHNTEDSPVLIVDGFSVIYQIYIGLDTICQGQWKEFCERLQMFVTRLKVCGVQPMFYFDSINDAFKHETWIKRRRAEMDSIDDFFRSIDEDLVLVAGQRCPLRELVPSILKHYCHVDVYQSVIETDTEMASMVRSLRPCKCIGVLSNDSDFIIYDLGGASWFFMGLQNQFCSSFHVYRCRRERFANWINLKPELLPILACVMGNDSMPFKDLRSFHASYTAKDKPILKPHLLIFKLAAYISRLNKKFASKDKLIEHLQFNILPHALPSLSKSVAIYERNFSFETWTDEIKCSSNIPPWLLSNLLQKHHVTEHPSAIIQFIHSSVIYQGACFESPSRTGLPAIHSILRPVFRRLYGFVVNKSAHLNLYCASPDSNLDQPIKFESEIVETSLSFQECFSDASDLQRLEVVLCLWGCLDMDLATLFDLPPHLAVWTVILRYLFKNLTQMHLWELEALLSVPLCLAECNCTRLAKLEVEDVGTRFIHISSLINEALLMMFRVLCATNYSGSAQSIASFLLFDGKLFNKIYREYFRNGECFTNKDQLLSQLKCLAFF